MKFKFIFSKNFLNAPRSKTVGRNYEIKVGTSFSFSKQSNKILHRYSS